MDTKIFVILAIAGALAAIFFLSRSTVKDAASPARRLSKLIAQRSDYQIFIGVPFAAPKEWATAMPQGPDLLDVQGYGALRISDARAFVVAYPSGQIVNAEPCGMPLPASLIGLEPASRAESDFVRSGDLAQGREYIQVTYGPSATRPREKGHYATTLKNISPERVRVLRFAGYSRSADGWKLSTVSRQFYSAEEFCEWYGLGSRKWIEPGEAVADHNNYGSPPILWAYYCESASGKTFLAGGILE